MRTRQIVRELAPLLWPLWRGHKDRGPRLAGALERLGGFWIKLGQFLSLQYDMVPRDVCVALTGLQGSLPGISGDWALQIIERELGSLSMFKAIDPQPIAAASIGQVHVAILLDGTKVAVKVVSPEAELSYQTDFAFFRKLSRFSPSRLRLGDFAVEMETVMGEEVDLRYEAQNRTHGHKAWKKHGIRVPKVYLEYSTSKVLVTEWAEGQILADLARDLEWSLDTASRERLADKLFASFLRQVFEDNRYHGDLHPRNIFVDDKGRMTFIDLGSVNSTDLDFLYKFLAFINCTIKKDYAKAADFWCLLCTWPPRSKVEKFFSSIPDEIVRQRIRNKVSRAIAIWHTDSEVEALPFSQRSIENLTINLMTIVGECGGALQWSWLRLERALSAVEGTIRLINPNINYVKLMRRYLEKMEDRVKMQPVNPIVVVNKLAALLDRVDESTRLGANGVRLFSQMEGL